MTSQSGPVRTGLSRAGVACAGGLGRVLRILPPAAWGALAGVLAPVLWQSLPRYRRVALDNLTAWGRTPAEARALGRAAFRSNLLVFFETLAMPRLLARKGVRITTCCTPAAEADMAKLRAGEFPMGIGISGHTGVWELLGAEVARMCAPVPVVVSARFVKDPVVADYLDRLRRTYGIRAVEKNETLRFMHRELRRGSRNLYLFLCDQHFKGGVRAPFLGRSACTVAIPGKLMLRHDVPGLIGRCIRKKPGNYEIAIDTLDREAFRGLPAGEAERAVVAAINGYMGRTIEDAPEQWTWGHRRWRPCCQAAAPTPPAGAAQGPERVRTAPQARP